ncbi:MULTISPECIES: DedA family protein [unclassified Pseudonocardia]|uniref:DedA family protein n=1 Tax=unclassified Pseudonocardia TaxID=2619320 RepID=UPI002015FDAA|nr:MULTISPECIES: DedA family protein [unclassified Pseudonocardia]
MTQWVFDIVDRLGAAGIGLLIFLENVIPPIPSEVILPLGGFRASTGAMDPIGVWAAATIGAVAGALVLYALGSWLGFERVHALAGKRWFVLSSQKDLEKGLVLFERYGSWFVLGGRCIPIVRSLISIPAGIAGMPLSRFTALSALGSAVWNALFVYLGFALGERWEVVEGYMSPISKVVAVAGALVLVWLVWRKVRQRRARGGVEEADAAPR